MNLKTMNSRTFNELYASVTERKRQKEKKGGTHASRTFNELYVATLQINGDLFYTDI